MGDKWNIISSCSSNVGFDDNLCHVEEERLHALQLQPLQGNLHHQHHCGDYGFINNNPTMEEIYSAMGGLFTHLDFYRMRHRAYVEAALPHPHTDNYSNHFASPPWRGFVVSMAMNHRECQYLQAVIDEGNPVYVTMILLEVKDYLHELMTHRFGSYLIQKIFQARRGVTCQQMDLTVFLIISNHRKLKDVCMDHHGTRAMQTMIANVRHPFTGYVVVYMLQHITIPLMKNVNGSYVIVQCVKFFPPKHKKIILDEVARNCVDIATDKIGCSVVKKCLDYGGRTSAIDILVAQIISNAMILSEDPYGNYVVQRVIQMKIPLANEQMVQELRSKFDRLSVNKYASNVVEYLLSFSNQDAVKVIAEEIMRSRNFLNVLHDPYGNYVAQRALRCTKGHVRRRFSSLIKSHRLALQSHIYGKNVLTLAMAYTEGSEFNF